MYTEDILQNSKGI